MRDASPRAPRAPIADIQTARCTRCAVYVPREDLRRASNGLLYCDDCGVPTAAEPWAGTSLEDMGWVHPSLPVPLGRPGRIVAGLMLLATLTFPLAACLSQL